jgi:hypothetical protein
MNIEELAKILSKEAIRMYFIMVIDEVNKNTEA